MNSFVFINVHRPFSRANFYNFRQTVLKTIICKHIRLKNSRKMFVGKSPSASTEQLPAARNLYYSCEKSLLLFAEIVFHLELIPHAYVGIVFTSEKSPQVTWRQFLFRKKIIPAIVMICGNRFHIGTKTLPPVRTSFFTSERLLLPARTSFFTSEKLPSARANIVFT